MIYGQIIFWISTFILPKTCINKMESLCARFLWSGSIEKAKGIKVAWADVCYPKLEGGLGLRRLGLWNSTLCLKLVWLLFSGSGSLWVAWHQHHHLRGRSLWSLKAATTDSWNWKSLLNLRNIAEPFIRCNLGNGNIASFWFDSWSSLGPLINWYGENGPREMRLPVHSLVSAACDDFGWNLPPVRSSQARNLHALLSTVNPPDPSNGDDSYCWVIHGISYNHFPTASTWDAIRPRAALKGWASSIWFKGATPRHAFTMWMAQLNRLPTRSRMVSWGLPVTPTCCLCSNYDETLEHLFLTCQFSQRVWNLIQAHMHLPVCIFYTWSSLISWTRLRTDSSPSILRKLASQAAVYHIWKQRNNLIHNQISATPAAVYKTIEKELRNTITARRNQKKFRNLMPLWIR